MKKILLLILLFIGCDDSSPTGNEDVHPLVGVWIWTSTSTFDGTTTVSSVPSTDSDETIIMNEDGTMSMTGKLDGVSYTASGTWSTNSNKLTWIITLSGESTSNTLILDYTISETVFTGIVVNTVNGVEVTTTYIYTNSLNDSQTEDSVSPLIGKVMFKTVV